MKKLSIALCLALSLAPAVPCLELRDGLVRLVIDDRTGRFALYELADASRNRYEPLLYDKETRTTFATLSVDGKTYRLGESSEFRVSVARDGAGARVEYRSSFCSVRQSFSFLTSPGSSLTDGVSIDYVIENLSTKESSIGLRILYDTWLGEKSSAHFSASSSGALTTETFLEGDYADTWIRSGEAAGGSGSLQLQLAPPATRPDRLVAANWKRLSDAIWAFDKAASRGFTLLPYSINDSALALYFEPAVLRPGSTRAVRSILSRPHDGYPSGAPAAATTAAVAATPVDTAPLDAVADLVAVRALLDAIDEALAAGRKPSEADLAAMKAALERLEARKRKY